MWRYPTGENSTSAGPACGDGIRSSLDRDLRARSHSGADRPVRRRQPSSHRLDCLFRVFNIATPTSTRQAADELTSLLVQPVDEPFVFAPGRIRARLDAGAFTLPDNLAGRLEGKSSLGRLGYGFYIPPRRSCIDPGASGHITLELSTSPACRSLWHENRSACMCCA